jgi:ABC-type nitrate/sulfonate/bicarbonate transport system permease component
VRLSISVSLLLTVVSELIMSTDGLGTYLLKAQSAFEVSGVIAGLIVIAGAALAVNSLTQALAGRWLSWNVRRTALGEAGR